MAGDVISFHVFGQVVVVLNSIKATKDLLERRGEIYSNRPVFTIHEMYVVLSFDIRTRDLIEFRMKWEWAVPFTRYTEYWRRARKLLDRGLRPGAIATYRPLLQTNTRILLTQLLETPDDWESHLV
jgi:cytochrome P450